MIILFILIITLLFGAFITIHEFGHSIAAKTLGAWMEGLAISMDPKLLSRARGEMIYSLRVLPIGGFCSMEGEEEVSDDLRPFSSKPAWKKFTILVAGAFLNFVTGLAIPLVLSSVVGSPSAPMVSGYPPGAKGIQETGLLPGDEFYRIDGRCIYFQSDVILFLGRAEENMAVEVLWDGRRFDLDILHLPYRTLTDKNGQQSLKWGVMVEEFQEAGSLNTLRNAWYQPIDYVRTVWLSLGDSIRGTVSFNDMADPIGIFATAGEVGQQRAAIAGMTGALLSIFSSVALIAINLAVMNLLPIPVLDDGQILLLLVGGIYHFLTHGRIDQRYPDYISTVGFFCPIVLAVVVTISDVSKLIL